jgi:hypothetical protein
MIVQPSFSGPPFAKRRSGRRSIPAHSRISLRTGSQLREDAAKGSGYIVKLLLLGPRKEARYFLFGGHAFGMSSTVTRGHFDRFILH